MYFLRYIDPVLEYKRLNCRELVATDRLSCVRTVMRLFDALAITENGVVPEDTEHYPTMIEMWFQFAVIWGIGGPLAEDDRKKYASFLSSPDFVFDYRSP